MTKKSTTMSMTTTTMMMTNNLSRMCIATREIKPIIELFRVCLTPSGNVLIQKDKHIEGRGAYISRNIEAINIARKKKLLNKALRCNVPEEIYDELIALC